MLVLFCNFGSRSIMFPSFATKFKFKSLLFFFNKKLRFLNSTYYLITRLIYTNFFLSSTKIIKNNLLFFNKTMKYFFLKFSTRYFLQLKYNCKFYNFEFVKK